MKLSIIGSRGLNYKFELSSQVDCIISGGARGIDTDARNYALANNIKLIEVLPDYKKYGRLAPIIRNKEIINAGDKVLAIWDGKSKGTKMGIAYAKSIKKPLIIINLSKAAQQAINFEKA